jgi:hypothetical protein
VFIEKLMDPKRPIGRHLAVLSITYNAGSGAYVSRLARVEVAPRTPKNASFITNHELHVVSP